MCTEILTGFIHVFLECIWCLYMYMCKNKASLWKLNGGKQVSSNNYTANKKTKRTILLIIFFSSKYNLSRHCIRHIILFTRSFITIITVSWFQLTIYQSLFCDDVVHQHFHDHQDAFDVCLYRKLEEIHKYQSGLHL